MISINLGEKLIKLRCRQLNTGLLKRRSDFPLVQLAIMISVNALEKLPELLLRLFDEFSKF